MRNCQIVSLGFFIMFAGLFAHSGRGGGDDVESRVVLILVAVCALVVDSILKSNAGR